MYDAFHGFFSLLSAPSLSPSRVVDILFFPMSSPPLLFFYFIVLSLVSSLFPLIHMFPSLISPYTSIF